MAEFYTQLNRKLSDFIAEQSIFFTATAADQGRINLSPKGMNSFYCLDDNTVMYLDVTGSGNETAAHLLQQSRMTIMFCSFTKHPLILRLYGQARSIKPRDTEWAGYVKDIDLLPGARQLIVLAIDSVQTSCGYGVPLVTEMESRETLRRWAEKKGEAGVKAYWKEKNQTSIDGLPTGILSTELGDNT